MKKHGLLFLFLLSLIANAQNNNTWAVKLNSHVERRTWKLTYKWEKDEKSLGGASLVLTKQGKTIWQGTTDSNGDFTVMVPGNDVFILTVSWPGCNPKRITIVTTGVPTDIQNDNSFHPTFEIIGGFIMAKPFPGIDYNGLQEPLVKVVYSPKLKNFDDDATYTEYGTAIVTKIKEAEMILINKFCGLNKQGDDALAIPDCPLARRLYKEAIATIPGEEYPVIQLAKVPDCEKIEEEKKKAEEAKKAAEEKALADKQKALADKEKAAEEAKKAEEEKALADKAVKEKAAEEAKKAAEEKALADKANKDKATEEAKKAAEEKALADKANKDKAAAEKAEADKLAKEKAAADKETKTKALTEKEAADKEAKSKALAEKENAAKKRKAEKDAEDAKNKMPGDEGKVKKHEYETESKDGEPVIGHGDNKYRTPQVLSPNKYKDAVTKADGFFKMKRWAEAKPAYEEVLKIKPDDVYATGKLAEVNKMLAK